MVVIICNCILNVLVYKKKNETIFIKKHLQPKGFSWKKYMQSCPEMCSISWTPISAIRLEEPLHSATRQKIKAQPKMNCYQTLGTAQNRGKYKDGGEGCENKCPVGKKNMTR